ncbi:MAG: EthD family reductase [Bacteroidales bacterium]
MIKASIFYPGGEGKTFDFDYYMNKHAALVNSIPGNLIKGFQAEKGLAGMEPGSPPAYVAMAHLLFDNPDYLQKFMAMSGKLMEDIPNFTNTEPVIQISEVLV